MLNWCLRYCFVGTICLLFSGLVSYASGPVLTDHSFIFNARQDSPNVEILDYRYGSSRQPGARPSQDELNSGVIPQSTAIIGRMLRGDSLYVKWRIKSTGAVYEDTVDLQNALPANITDHKIYFVVRGTQLYVYLVSPEKRSEADPPGPLRMYSYLKVKTVYPAKAR